MRISRKNSLLLIVIAVSVVCAALIGRQFPEDIVIENAGHTPTNQHANREMPQPLQSKSAVVEIENENLGDSGQLYTAVDTNVIAGGVLEDFVSTQPVEAFEIGAVDADFLRNEIRRPETDYFNIRLLGEYEMQLSPFSKESYVEGQRSGYARYMGRILDEESSSALFVVSPDGTVSGTIRSSLGYFRIQSTGTLPYHFVWKMDPAHAYSFD